MREILFRGKRIDNGEWAYGNLNYGTIEIKSIKDSYYISDFDVNPWDKKFYPVIPETIGQSTGMTDKNDKKIFDGDILKEYGSMPEHSLMVIRNVGFGCFIEFYFHGEKHSTEQVGHIGWLSYDEVIGNIYDNPELLEVTNWD